MHDLQQKAIAEVARDHGQALGACDGLRDFAVGLGLPAWQGRPLDPEHGIDPILAAIFARSTNTYWGAIEQARIGFGEQAAMLNRSLFEDMVDAHWCTLDPDLAVQRYEQHHDHSKMLLGDAVLQHPGYFPKIEVPDYASGDREALNKLFGVYGERSWTGASLYDRVNQIESLWGDDPKNREVLQFFRRIVHRENNQTLHLSAQAMNQLVRSHGPAGLTLKFGPGSEMLGRVLFGAFWIFGQTVSLVLEHFAFDCGEQFSEVYDGQKHVFRDLSSEDLREVGRNDPCPCESGKKYKRCHGK